METVTTTAGNRKQAILWSLRILLSFLFLISAVAKLYPSPYFALSTFEVKQLLPMGFSEGFAAYFSRTLIGCELALGFLLLQPHFFRRLVLPVSFLLLFIFSAHLTYEIISTGNKGNCGCFGALLPMTPLQAVIKNVIAMALIGYVYKQTEENKNRSNFSLLLAVTFASILSVFMLGPIRPASETTAASGQVVVVEDEGDNNGSQANAVTDGDTTKTASGDNKVKEGDPAGKEEVKKKDEPAAKKSGFANLFPDIDNGKKILCFFAPGCEHCRDAAKQLTEMKKQVPDFPDIRIVFMDEEPEVIPAFFEFAGSKYTHMVMDVGKFWQTLGGSRDTPGVFYIWNGNVVKVYDGIDANAFKAKEFKTLVQKPWSEVK